MTAPALVVVGTSRGGLAALDVLLSGIPRDFTPAIAVVQHRGSESGRGLRAMLQRRSTLPVREPNDNEEILGGHVYLAPASYHTLVEPGLFSLSAGPPERFARPSIDVLFESAADAYGPAVIGVILTGANTDGASGAKRIKESGGFVLVQDPDTAECAVMPRAALTVVAADRILLLSEMAGALTVLAGRAERRQAHV